MSALVPHKTKSPHLVFTIPARDQEKYGAIPEGPREQLDFLLDCMGEIYLGLEAGARGSKGICVRISKREAHSRRGVSWQNLRLLWRTFRDSGFNWWTLVNGSKVRKSAETVETWSDEFKEEVRLRMQRNQRSSAAALRELRSDIRKGDAIPGLGTWKQIFRKRFPDLALPEQCPNLKELLPGLTDESLRRIAAMPKIELAIARQGTAAALEYAPNIPRTREGMRFMEVIYIDDWKHDHKVHVRGFGPCDLLQLHALDLATAYNLKFGIQPVIPDEDGHKEKLKERSAMLLIGWMLETYGYPADYQIRIVCERGTATVRAAAARALFELTEGRVVVGYTGMQGEFVAGWEERAVGNFRGKGLLESMHNLYHNELASLPGQTGKDRDHSPATLTSQTRYSMAVDKASMLLSPADRVRLKLPFIGVEEAMALTEEMLERVHDRRDHAMEGFRFMPEWRPRGSMAEYTPEWLLLEKGIVPNLDAWEMEKYPRFETTKERLRWLASQTRFEKFPRHALKMFYDAWHVEKRITGQGLFEFTWEKRDYSYRPPTPEEALPENTDCLAYFNPLDMSRIILTHNGGSKHGAYIATWPRYIMRHNDREEGSKLIAFKRGTVLRHLDNVNRRDAARIEEERRALQENARIFSDAGLIESTTEDLSQDGSDAVEGTGLRAACPRVAGQSISRGEESVSSVNGPDAAAPAPSHEPGQTDSSPAIMARAEVAPTPPTHNGQGARSFFQHAGRIAAEQQRNAASDRRAVETVKTEAEMRREGNNALMEFEVPGE